MMRKSLQGKLWGRDFQGRGGSKCKGPEAGGSWVVWRHRKKAEGVVGDRSWLGVEGGDVEMQAGRG